MIKQSLTDRRAMLGRLTLELTNKRGPLSEGEKFKLRSLRLEMDELEDAIKDEDADKYHRAFVKGLRFGFDAKSPLTQDEHRLIQAHNTGTALLESRDMDIGLLGGAYPSAPITAGLSIPTQMADAITSGLRDTGPMFRLSTIFDTLSGALRMYPEEDDATIAGERLVENQSASTADIAQINEVALSSYMYGSRMIKVSASLAQDFGFDLEQFLSERFAVRIARAANTDFTIGIGSSMPTGFVTGAASAGTAVGAGANDGVSGIGTLGSVDFSTLESAVDPEYRRNAVWQCHANTLTKLRAQLDRDGRALFPGLHNSPDGVDRIFNYPVVPNPNLAQLPVSASSPAVSSVTLAFGDFSKYVIRRAPPILVMLKQRFIDQGQYAYILWQRMDGNIIDGGAGAIKTLQNVY